MNNLSSLEQPESLEILLQRLKKRADLEADFECLFRLFHDRVYRWIPAGTPPESRSDLTQIVFLRVFKYMDSCPVQGFEPWLYRVARNVYLDWRRKNQRRPETPWPNSDGASREPTIPDEQESAESRAISREDREQLWHAVGRLPPKMQRCVLLRIGQDMSTNETAELLRVAPGTVKAHLSQAKNKLRKDLTARFNRIDDAFEE
ncbi:MAG: sigma-70 family RNA polymerase sigma factor [Acidobacteriota bacterium]